MSKRRRVGVRHAPAAQAEQDRQALIAYAKRNGLEHLLPPEPRPRMWDLMDLMWLYQFRLEVLRFCAFWSIAIFGIWVGIHIKFGWMIDFTGVFHYTWLFVLVEVLLLLMVKFTLAMKGNDR